jgi:mono/diheme cytochrome c family protein
MLLTAAPALLCLVWLSGCENNYPADLHYPLRDDPLLPAAGFSNVDSAKIRLDRPGEFDRPGDPLPWLLPNLTPEQSKTILFPANLASGLRQKLDATLEQMFGTPRSPKVAGFDGDEKVRTACKLEEPTLAHGSQLYRIHCLHCHGLTGNGRGPTSPWVNPHPRDYRQGKFKFMSVRAVSATGGNSHKPRRADLIRTIGEGVDGTSMPSFGLLSQQELEDLTSYVIHLSIRGEIEFLSMQKLFDEGTDATPDQVPDDVNSTLTGRFSPAKLWAAAQDPRYEIVPESQPPTGTAFEASVKRGHTIFASKDYNCLGCHIDFGRQAAYFYDAWGNVGRPLDLTVGIYRGGRRPIDLYYRIMGGVPPSSMPQVGRQTPDETTGLTSAQIWDVVNFLRLLPYPERRDKILTGKDKVE